MFCPNCGASLPEGAKFCGMCGKPIPEAAAKAEAVPPVNTEEITPNEPVQTVEQPIPEPVQTVELPTPEPVMNTEIKNDPMDFTPLVAAPIEPPKKKKSKKGLVIGLSAAAAVVIAGGAVGYFGFHDDITRLIMGNENYSKMIEEHSYSDYIGLKNMGEGTLDKMLASQIDTAAVSNSGKSGSSDFSDIESIGIILSEKKNEFSEILNGNNTVSFDASGEFHIGDELLDYANQNADSDIKIKDYIDFLNSLKFSGSVTAGDVSEAVFNIACESGSFISCDIIADKDGNAVGSFPEISDKYYRIEKDETENSDKEEEKQEINPFGEAQMKRLREKVGEIYIKYFGKGNITVTKDYELKKGDTVIKGTAIISEFDSVLINNFMTEVNDFLHNDEYVRGYCTGTLGMEQGDFALMFENDEKINGSYKVINLVDKHNNVIGKRIELNDNDKEEKVEIEYLKEDKEQVFLFANSEFKLLVRNTLTDNKNGKANIKLFNQENESFLSAQALSLDVIYSDLEKAEIFGQEVNTGSVTVKIADDDMFIKGTLGMLYSFSSIADKGLGGNDVSDEMMSVQQNNTKNQSTELLKSLIEALSKTELTVTLKKEGEGFNLQYSLSLGDMLSIKASTNANALMKTTEMPEASKIFDMEDDEEEALSKALLERVKEFAEKDPYFGKIVNVNDINDQIKEIEEENNFKKNYADFNKYSSTRTADNYAEDIYGKIDSGLTDLLAENGAESGGVIKLYFDKEGNTEVIDSAGFDDTDFSALLKDCANSCYVEITLDWRHIAGIGVTAILTDDKSNIPDSLPKWYNYQDKVYDWENEEGYIGYFAAGTYPKLYEGTSTAEGNYVNLDKDIKALEGYAKTVGRFTENYLKSREYTVTTVNDYVSLVLERNTAGWQAVTAYRGIWEYDVSEVFDESFLTLYLDALNKNTSISAIADDVRIELFFDNIEDDTIKKPWFVGVGVNYVKDNDKFVQYGKPQCEDYINGYYGWTGKEYLWEGAESGYYLGAGGIVYPLGTYSATMGDVLIPNNLYPGDYVTGKDIVSAYNYTKLDPTGVNGVWTLTSVDDIPLEQYAKENGYKLSELQKNLVIYGDQIEVEDITGINTYSITNDSYGFRLHYDDMRFADFTFDPINHTLEYKGLINGRDIVTFKFTDGYVIIDNPELYQGDFDIASLAGTWVLTKIGGVSAAEQSDSAANYTIEIGTDGSVKVCGDTGYKAIPTYTGFRVYIENINYAIWELNYDKNTDTLTDSTNGENEIYLFERSQ